MSGTDGLGGASLGGRMVFGGVATGLDTNALIQSLIQVEAQPLIRYQRRVDELEETQKLFRDLNSKLLTLRDAARDIDNRSSTLGGDSADEELLTFEATSENDTRITASATGDAVPSTYGIKVGQLADVGREYSTGQASQDTTLGYGGETLTVDYGDATSQIDVNLNANTTLLELRDAINGHANNDGDVQASVLYDGTDYHLIIAGTTTGASNDVTITESAGMTGFIDTALEQAAQDAYIEVLGFTVTRESNTIDDVIDGVTLDLHSAGTYNNESDTSETFADTQDFSYINEIVDVEISMDVEAIAGKLDTLVSAFNDLRNFIKEHSKFDEETKETGPLSGDSTVSTIELLVQRTLIQNFTFTDDPDDTVYQGLAEIGITTNSNGRFTLDQDKLEEALVNDVQAVKLLLKGDSTRDVDDNEGDGVATKLARVLKPIVRSGDGTLAVRDQGFDEQIESLEDRMDRFEAYLVKREESLIQRFTALERTVSTLQSQQDFLFRLG